MSWEVRSFLGPNTPARRRIPAMAGHEVPAKLNVARHLARLDGRFPVTFPSLTSFSRWCAEEHLPGPTTHALGRVRGS